MTPMPLHVRRSLLSAGGVSLALMAAFLPLFITSCGKAPAVETINLANLATEGSALTYVADHEGYFTRNHLSVAIKDYPTGVAGLAALENGEADIADMTDFVLAGAALRGEQVKVTGAIAVGFSQSIVGLKSRGVSGVKDLPGKKVGLARGTIAEFFLSRLLSLNGLSIESVTLVNLPPSEWENALASGSVDAVIGWPPYIPQISRRFGNDAAVWDAQSFQPLFGIMVSTQSWLSGHADAARRFWLALSQAQDFIVAHPDVAKTIVREKLGYDQAYIDEVWKGYDFSISLPESLVVAMEDEARWLISNKLTAALAVPDFTDYIYSGALSAVKPDSVNIIK
jgi:NitT/TauT family transport system substrate-binding protein